MTRASSCSSHSKRTRNSMSLRSSCQQNKDEKPVLIKFQVDTGASCSTLTLRDYKRITSTIPDQSNTKLKLYDQSVIHPVGSTKLYCTVNGLTKKVNFEIIEHASTSLLPGGKPTCHFIVHPLKGSLP